LRLRGWRILGRRIKTPRGEIDLVARRGRMVAFIEVKWRAKASDLGQAIDPWRLRRVVAASEVVAQRYAAVTDTIRVDVILVSPWRWPQVIENAALA
jgi:putative endonuclease